MGVGKGSLSLANKIVKVKRPEVSFCLFLSSLLTEESIKLKNLFIYCKLYW